MKLRYSLYVQTVGLLGLYILGLLLVMFVAFNMRFGMGWDGIISSPWGARFERIAEDLAIELSTASPGQWSDRLSRYGRRYNSDFYVFDSLGNQLAGTVVQPPPRVYKEMTKFPVSPDFFKRLADGPKKIMFLRRPSANMRRFGIQEDGAVWLGQRIPLHKQGDVPRPSLLLVRTYHVWQSGLLLDLQIVGYVVAGVFALSVVFWLPFTYNIARRLSILTAATEQIAEGRFDVRLKPGIADEIGRLTDAINTMAQRLNRHMNGQKRVLGDIAHELVTPLARLEMAVEVAATASEKDRTELIADAREEVIEMQNLVEELLAFAKAGLKGREANLQPCNLQVIVDESISRLQCEERVVVSVDAKLCINADPLLLSRAISNVVRNSLRYAPDSAVTINCVRQGGEILVQINDDGPGVSEDVINYLGEPFFRPEFARTRDSGGFGLGLAIVKTCIEACGGTVSLANRPEGGLLVTMRLQPATVASDALLSPSAS